MGEVEPALYPLYAYLYDAAGRYGRPTTLQYEAELRACLDGPVRQAMAESREVRITDGGDSLVFHAAGGKILWAGGESRPDGRPW